MNLNELRFGIESSFCTCAQCDSRVDEWPDADGSEPGHPVVYIPQTKVFTGICPSGHMNEWSLARAKAGETAPEDVTVRVLGRFVSQENCTHGKRGEFHLEEGHRLVTAHGVVKGPADLWMCGYCGRRERLTAKNEKSGIVLP